MPQIIVVTDHGEAPAETFRERVNSVVFESGQAAAQLLERIEWAVGDASEAEREKSSAVRANGYAEPRAASVVTTAS